ncbi:MAG: 1-acyl-sn-glycerol-3-phosphate acyltransferase [Ruminococcaceae bacterium]|nr:1-acyl-sn-glycerol-3-phosphate acyltransferase [Oscillospiraceae bacterium]
MLLCLVKNLVKCFMYCFFRLHVHGTDNFPKEGAAIVALNHKSFWDAPLIASVLPRPLAFMAKKELFSIPVLGAILKWAGAFPVSRGNADVSAIKAALSALRAGKVMAIFPEGTRVKNGEEHVAKAGVALIAQKTGAPVVPIALSGRYRFRAKVDVYIGTPITIKAPDGGRLSADQLQEASDRLLKTILDMAETGNIR